MKKKTDNNLIYREFDGFSHTPPVPRTEIPSSHSRFEPRKAIKIHNPGHTPWYVYEGAKGCAEGVEEPVDRDKRRYIESGRRRRRRKVDGQGSK